MKTLLGLTIWFWLSMYLSLAAHELGHAIAGWRNGYEIGAIGIGIGRPSIWARIGGVRVYLGSRRWGIGLCLAIHSQLFPMRREQIAFTRGGMSANAVVAAVAFVLGVALPASRLIWLILGLVNLLTIACAWQSGGPAGLPFKTDGAKLRAHAGNESLYSAVSLAQPNPLLIELLSGTGYHSYRFIARMQGAIALAEIGQYGRADALRELALSEWIDPDPSMRGYACFVSAIYCTQQGRYAEALQHATEAEAGFETRGNPRGVIMTRIYRARILLKDNCGPQAVALIRAVDGDGMKDLLVSGERLFIAALLEASLESSEIGDIQSVLDRAERGAPETGDLGLCLLLARCHTRLGAYSRAADLAAAALKAAETTFIACPDADWRAAYIEAKRQDLSMVTEVLVAAGQPDALANIDAHFEAVYASNQAAAADAVLKARVGEQRSSIAYGAAAVSLLTSFAVGGSGNIHPVQSNMDWHWHSVYAGMMAIALVVAFGNLIVFPVFRISAAGRSAGGWIALITSAIPWVGFLVFSSFG